MKTRTAQLLQLRPGRLPPPGWRAIAPGIARHEQPIREARQSEQAEHKAQAAEQLAAQCLELARQAQEAAARAAAEADKASTRAQQLVTDSQVLGEGAARAVAGVQEARGELARLSGLVARAYTAADTARAAARRAEEAVALLAKYKPVGIEALAFGENDISIVLTDGRSFHKRVRGLQGERGPRGYGSSGPAGAGVSSSRFDPVTNHLLFTLTNGTTIDAGEVPMPYDDYSDAEYLDDQDSVGAVLTFTFSSPVQKVWVEMTIGDESAEGRVRADGADPDADTGTLLHPGQTQPLSVTTSEVRVLAPSGATVSVYGYRR